ncbi:hypothetical protein [uncultured Thiodictyon sp.]|uniref:hypothetical protein n=1 Tax=uncultured Thiodictyon sp. TaxID=1846217 RepID=UPI0025E561AE|nr:hypothetical protein [uncultured Thiodictyon sp.]
MEAETGTQIEPLIEEELKQLSSNTLSGYFELNSDLSRDLLPQCGIHDLDPSPAGIVRSFDVRLVGNLAGNLALVSDERLSALVAILALEDARQVEQAIQRCAEISVVPTLTYVWIPRRGLAELVEPLRRYIVIRKLLQQQAASEGLARRLRNERDKTRRQLREQIKERLGRIALERGDVAIRRLGDPDESINVTSWHGFSDYLAVQVHALYPKEVKVRTMNVNRLYNVDNYKIKRTEKLLQGILNFDDQPIHLRTDLFGENDGSELAALIDGTLGIYSNGILIARAGGWDLKTPKETDGPLRELLSLIQDTLLDKKRKSCELSELRAKLIAPPFGLPTAVMPIFTAVAIRKDAHRLKWVNQKGTFESLLWDAFSKGSNLKLRFDTFKPGQLQVLSALHQVILIAPSAAVDMEEQARETVTGLRSYYSGLPDAVKGSPKLSDPVRSLFQKLKQPGVDAQDVADCLMSLTKNAVDGEETCAVLRGLFDSIETIKDERVATVRQVITPAMQDPGQKQRIIDTIKRQGKPILAHALERLDQGEPEALSEVIHAIAGKGLDRCSDIEIGRLSGDLLRLMEQAAEPEPSLAQEPAQIINLEATFDQELAALIRRYQTTLDTARLVEILASHLDGLSILAAAGCPPAEDCP